MIHRISLSETSAVVTTSGVRHQGERFRLEGVEWRDRSKSASDGVPQLARARGVVLYSPALRYQNYGGGYGRGPYGSIDCGMMYKGMSLGR